MSESFTQARFKTSLMTFLDYFNDMSEATFDNHSTKLRLLINYVEHEEPLRDLITFLHHLAGDSYNKWIQKTLEGSVPFKLPDLPSESAAYSYMLLFNLKRRYVELRSVLSRRFAGGDLNSRFSNFASHVIAPLAAYIKRVGDGMMAIMEREDPDHQKRHDLQQLVYAVTQQIDEGTTPAAPAPAAAPAPSSPPAPAPAPGLIAELGSPKPPPAPVRRSPPAPMSRPAPAAPRASRPTTSRAALKIAGTSFEKCIRDLIYEISFAGDFDPADQVDLMTDLKMLRLELKKNYPNRKRMVGWLDAMRSQSSLSPHADRAIAELDKL